MLIRPFAEVNAATEMSRRRAENMGECRIAALLQSVGKNGLHFRAGMQCPEDSHRSDSGASQFGSYVWCDSGESQHIDFEHFSGAECRFKILSGEVPQAEIKTFSRRGLFDDVRMAFELIADRRSNEVSSI